MPAPMPMPPSSPKRERELVDDVLLCTPSGLLNPDAMGFSRHPLHRANLHGPWGRQKRWDYWCVTWEGHAFSLTYADLDYLGLATATFLDFSRGKELEAFVPVPFALGFSQPSTVSGGDIVFDKLGLLFTIRQAPRGTHLCSRFKRDGQYVEADLFVHRPEGHETLNVVIPWSEERFQFTSKQNTLPVTGHVRVSGLKHTLGPENNAFACLDYGRGIWPQKTNWNWASASGRNRGRVIGLQFGGLWTDGTGSTENGLCLDGRLHKISEDIRFDYDRRNFKKPWHLKTVGSDRVDLEFRPEHEKQMRVPLVFASAELHLCFGRFHGTVRDDQSERIPIDGLFGWSEEMRARW